MMRMSLRKFLAFLPQMLMFATGSLAAAAWNQLHNPWLTPLLGTTTILCGLSGVITTIAKAENAYENGWHKLLGECPGCEKRDHLVADCSREIAQLKHALTALKVD